MDILEKKQAELNLVRSVINLIDDNMEQGLEIGDVSRLLGELAQEYSSAVYQEDTP